VRSRYAVVANHHRATSLCRKLYQQHHLIIEPNFMFMSSSFNNWFEYESSLFKPISSKHTSSSTHLHPYPWGSLAGTHWDVKNGVILWQSSTGMLGPKRGWLWRPTSLGYRNRYVLICIFATFLTKHVLKPWWPWTYQNSAVKRASARVVPGWVNSWEV
jgi:hypothetical protein